jgi:cysteinyl-tRNA synthetase
MSAHYRSPMNYSNIHLESASDRVYYIYEVLLYLATKCFSA